MMTKEQKKEYLRQRYLRNKDDALAKAKIYREKNKEKIRADQQSEKVKAYHREHRRANRAKNNENQRLWRKANPEKAKASERKYKEANRDKIKARDSAWKRDNRKIVSAKEKERKKNDLNFSIKKRLKSRVWHSVNRQSGKKAKRTMELLGCSIASFRIYIESKFKPGMTWDNIHLDHIVPCALFDLTKQEHQKICFHFSNYQPLFPSDNITKGDSVPSPVQMGLPIPA